MMKGFKILCILLAFFLPSMTTLTFASAGWVGVSAQVPTTWDQVHELTQQSSSRWGSQVIQNSSSTYCVRTCKRVCDTIVEVVCNASGAGCRTIIRNVCRYFCETICYVVNP